MNIILKKKFEKTTEKKPKVPSPKPQIQRDNKLELFFLFVSAGL